MVGLAATALLGRELPYIRVLIIRVLIATTFGRPGFPRGAMQSGAHAVVVKDAPAAELGEGARRVHEGLRWWIRLWRPTPLCPRRLR